MLRRLLVTTLLMTVPGVAPALSQTCDALQAGPSGRVVSISDGDTFDLDTGLTVRLVGIQAPKLPLGRDGFEAWPLGDEAKATIEDLVMGQQVSLYYGGESRDRHGRALAHVMVERDGEVVWVQAEMLRLGLARVYSFPDNRSCLEVLYAAEAQGAVRIDKNGTTDLRLENRSDDVDLMFGSGNSLGLIEPQKSAFQARLRLLAGRRFTVCAGIQACLIASGDEDFLIHGNSTPWDHAPVDLLCREAGGYAAMLRDESRFHVAMKAPFMAASSQAGWNRLRDAVWRD